MDVLDPREVAGHQNKVPNGPSSAQLARLFEQIFARYEKASAIGFATIPATDEGGLSLAAVNRMIMGAIRGVNSRSQPRRLGYVEDHLLPGERVKYRAHLHKLIYAWPALFAAGMTALGVWPFTSNVMWAGLLSIAVGFVPLLITHVKYTSSEFAVTDKRVIIKVGFIKRRTLETMLAKVEAIGVDQGLIGRILGFGTMTVTGTGGTKEAFTNIARPLEFRRQVQAQVSASESELSALAGARITESAKREERDCPYCAERILTRARICKHCGRDVEPMVSA
jgi:membrane protein YdbS with pleckstrin-like domain